MSVCGCERVYVCASCRSRQYASLVFSLEEVALRAQRLFFLLLQIGLLVIVQVIIINEKDVRHQRGICQIGTFV